MRISLFIVACILFVIASVVILGKADVLIPGLRKIRTEILSKRDLRGVRTVAGIEYLLISVSTLAVALYPSWTVLAMTVAFIVLSVVLAFWCIRTFFHTRITWGDAVSSIVDAVSNLALFT